MSLGLAVRQSLVTTQAFATLPEWVLGLFAGSDPLLPWDDDAAACSAAREGQYDGAPQSSAWGHGGRGFRASPGAEQQRAVFTWEMC